MPERTALVTGGGRGIGRGISLRLAAAGRAVAVADINLAGAEETARLISETGGRAVPLLLDITDSESVEAGVRAAELALGRIEIAVNNAGWDEHHRFIETDERFWLQVIEINYVGMLRICRRVAPGMVDGGWGRIVNIGSDAARVGSSLEAVYSGAKGGVVAFGKALAREVARSGVTVNTVCPGPTQTPLLGEILASGSDAQKVIDAMTRAVPMNRLGQPEDVAAAVNFFASEEAGYITGQTLSTSGGLTMA
jgi:2-hydroxycyclohexanecarboxyl-CoA dehydrogenase